MAGELVIRAMTRAELDLLVDWAANEGWNPGINDARIFWDTDLEGFVAAEMAGELIGGGSIVSYDGRFGFMGFFIVRPEHRGQGLGTRLWLRRRDLLLSRLQPHAAIGMDGVFDMQPFYARGGFAFSHRDLRFEGVGAAATLAKEIVDLSAVPFAEVFRYDAAHFPAPRERFLKAWITQRGSRALGSLKESVLRGYGVIRPCRKGFKIGPLFADDARIAQDLFRGLADFARGEPVYLDVPDDNPQAIAMVRALEMREVFGCARMYHGRPPSLPQTEIFGVSTFELG
ncbi:MAG TPA: GNAT family N-acetyltransferase [Casimicrobiaceae bacterium]|nr:GNAT family N-acetyltransferase [Casimicrobiaceae bacterium]